MKALLAGISILLLFSCKKESCAEKETTTVETALCGTAPLKNDQYTLCIDSVLEDSRCPSNANCTWQGVAKARFRFTVNNQVHTVDLSTLDLAPGYSTTASVAGYELKLIKLLPYPELGGPTGPVAATVEVTQ